MKTLILLQENSGQVDFLKSIPEPNVRQLVKTVIDGLAETFESIKTTLQAFGYYDRIINLTNTNCTKLRLLTEMVNESRNNHVFDLLILGHGDPKKLYLHNEIMTDTDVRSLLTQARQSFPGLNFKLRMVYMCNCFADSMSDAWLHIGAKTSIGCKDINFMPEPQTHFFFEDFVKKGYSVVEANSRSFQASNAIWAAAGLTAAKRTGSKLVVKGENIRFEGRRLAVGEAVERNIYASNAYNFTNILMLAGDKYELTAASSDRWRNGGSETNANGYKKGMFDAPRQGGYNVMTLVGELFNDNGNVLSYTGTHFKIGTSRNYEVPLSGYLMCHANDGMVFYGDNSGSVKLKIKRVR